MRKFITVFVFIVLAQHCFAQETDVKKIVREGIALHDKGEYEAAIKKYDEALTLNPDDFDANYEKSMTCLYLKRYDDCIALSKRILEKFSGHPNLKQVYTNWGSALDDEGKPEEALKVYDKGLTQFPGYYSLNYNKGLTCARLKKYEKAAACYKEALKANPLHPSSNYQLAALYQNSNRIASLLAYLTFIVIEPASERSKKAYDAVQEILYRNVKKEGNNTTVTLSPDLLGNAKKKAVPDDFSTAEFLFTLLGTNDNPKELDSMASTPPGKFDFKVQLLINGLAVEKKDHNGFFWEHYVPFFSELKQKGYTDVLANLLYYSKDTGAQFWVQRNKERTDEFYRWLQNRNW